MKGLTAKFHISLGQTFLVVSLLLTALFLGLVPDRIGAIREGRTALAEAIAANSSTFIVQKDIRRLEANLRLIIDRNDDLLSAAVRRTNGQIMVKIGDHDRYWDEFSGEFSTDSQLKVPIWAGSQKWGFIELRCRPLTTPGWWGVVLNPRMQLIVFIAICSFVVFYIYLSKMLRHLDPSSAVPTRVRSALDTLAEGLLVVDRNEYIVLANQAFAAVVGITPEKLVGRSASEFQWSTSDGLPVAKDSYPWLKAMQNGTALEKGTISLCDSKSKQRTFIVNCSLVLGDGNKHGGVLISFQDVTQLEEKETELRRSRDAAESANRAKSEFLANMSHEIRTPMNSILGFTEVLKRGFNKSEQDGKKYLQTIYSSGKHLLNLINDILDLSKVESGQLKIEQSPCAAHVIINEVIQVLGIKAEEKGITLEFEPEGAIPETILCDPPKLRQIVTNLVGNAIKFTEKGGVRVLLRPLLSDVRPQLCIEIIDTGVGISEDKLESIFEPFMQADNSVTRKFGGTGLGLAISHKFALALGGDITVGSELGKGSTFTVVVDTGPLDKVKLLQPHEVLTDQTEQDNAVHARWKLPSARVLVVDDGAENRELVKLVLEQTGLRVETAENGRIGLEKALVDTFDIILMDIQMPVMDGFTAVKSMRQEGLKIPIFALTAHAMKGYEQECLTAGYSGYLTKPIDIDALIHTLAELLGAERVECGDPEIVQESSSHNVPHQSEPFVRGCSLVSSLPADNPDFRVIIQKFVPRLKEQLTAMENAWNERNFDELASVAHWLKGAGGTIGFDVFTKPANTLEQFAKTKNEAQTKGIIAELFQLADRIVVPSDGSGTTASASTYRYDEKKIGLRGWKLGEQGQNGQNESSGPLVSRLSIDPRFHTVIKKFVRRLDQQLAGMENAWNDRDYQELESLAHWLKGAGGTVGFDEFTEPAHNLLQFAKAKSEAQIKGMILELQLMADKIVIPSDEKELKFASNEPI